MRKLRLIFPAIATFALCLLLPQWTLKAQSAAVAAAQQCQIGGQVVFGMQNQYPNVVFQYYEPTTTTVQYSGSTVVSIPANSTNNVVSVATLFPGWQVPVAIGIQEITNPSLQLNVGLSSGGPRINMNPAGFMLFRTINGTPTFYVDNPSASSIGLLQVFGISN
jgi:hypothetical protein